MSIKEQNTFAERFMKLRVLGWIVSSMAFGISLAASDAELARPFRVSADGQPIDVEIGHAAPFFADFDGDGIPDLLVGQFGGGKMRIFRNEGSRVGPAFIRSAWFQSAGAVGAVPSG